jgi:hypothetical protein
MGMCIPVYPFMTIPQVIYPHRFCKEESLLVLHNAKSLFRPGSLPVNGTGLEVHSAIISCNEDGFHLTKNNVPLPSQTGTGICSKRQTLFCREGQGGLGTWVDESGQPTFGKDITCKKGLKLLLFPYSRTTHDSPFNHFYLPIYPSNPLPPLK